MISVLIPVYNVEKNIRRCLDSILNQTFQDFEIVIVNDGTPDNSMDIVDEYASKYSRIKVLHNSKNMGLMWTRRVGYQNAEGEYIVFCDSDDYLPKDALDILYHSIKESNVDIVIGNYEKADDNGPTGLISNNQLIYGNKPNDVYKSLLKGEVSHSLWGKIYKSNLFKDKNYITYENFINAEDGMLLYQIVQNTDKIIIIDDSVYYYYSNEESSTNMRLSSNAIWSNVKFWSFIDNLFKSDTELYKYAKSKNIRFFTSLLKENYSKNEILQYIEIENFTEQLKFSQLKKVFTTKKALKYFVFLKLNGC